MAGLILDVGVRERERGGARERENEIPVFSSKE